MQNSLTKHVALPFKAVRNNSLGRGHAKIYLQLFHQFNLDYIIFTDEFYLCTQRSHLREGFTHFKTENSTHGFHIYYEITWNTTRI
jgi:hypothetical protein